MWKRFILWDFQRGGWQYDLMVGLILAFIFFTPRIWFRDQPRLRNPGGVAVAASEHGGLMFFIDKEELQDVPSAGQTSRLTANLRIQMSNNHLVVTRIEPILNSEGELQGYMASAKP